MAGKKGYSQNKAKTKAKTVSDLESAAGIEKSERIIKNAADRDAAESAKKEGKRTLFWGRIFLILGLIFFIGGFFYMQTRDDNAFMFMFSGIALFMLGCKMVLDGKKKAAGRTGRKTVKY